MSQAVIAACFKVPVQPTDKLVLVRMAQEADDIGGGIAITVPALAADCCTSERNIQYVIKKLLDLGVLILADNAGGGRGKARSYCIDLLRCRNLSYDAKGAKGAKGEGGCAVSGRQNGAKDEDGCTVSPSIQEVNITTPRNVTETDDDNARVRARARLREVGPKVLSLMGVSLDDPTWAGNYGRVAAWLAEDADPELDIYPTISRLMSKRGGQGPPRFLTYFDEEIAKARNARLKPLPEGKPDDRQADQRRPAPRSYGTDDENRRRTILSVVASGVEPGRASAAG